jgi:hypothetical protein
MLLILQGHFGNVVRFDGGPKGWPRREAAWEAWIGFGLALGTARLLNGNRKGCRMGSLDTGNFVFPLYYQNTKSGRIPCQIWVGILAWKCFCIKYNYFRQGARGVDKISTKRRRSAYSALAVLGRRPFGVGRVENRDGSEARWWQAEGDYSHRKSMIFLTLFRLSGQRICGVFISTGSNPQTGVFAEARSSFSEIAGWSADYGI